MWCIICITNWGIDFIPQLLAQFCSFFAPSRVETFKSQVLIFVATKKYVKWLLDACWAVGSFAVLTIVIFPLVRLKNRQTSLLRVLGALVALFALILLEKILLQIISQNFHKIAYADCIKENSTRSGSSTDSEPPAAKKEPGSVQTHPRLRMWG